MFEVAETKEMDDKDEGEQVAYGRVLTASVTPALCFCYKAIPVSGLRAQAGP